MTRTDDMPAICGNCGGDTFHAIFGPEDPVYEYRELIALRCAVCDEEVGPKEQALDS